MTSSCDHNREHMAAEIRRARPWSEALEGHLESCEACRAWAARLELHVRALGELQPLEAPVGLVERVAAGFEAEARSERALGALSGLPRREAPADLDGRVVAAMNGGAREDRVVDELRTVAGPGAPAELDRRVENLFLELKAEGRLADPEAPAELEQRVDEDLRDLPATIAGRLLGKLQRQQAPGDLEERVSADLSESGRPVAPILHLGRQRALVAGLAAAACLALWIGFQGPSGSTSQQPLNPIAVVTVSDAAEFSPAAQSFFDQVSGGSLSAMRVGREDAAPEVGLGSTGSGAGAPRTSAGQGSGSSSNTAPSVSGPGRTPATVGSGTSNSVGSQQLDSSIAPPLFDMIGSAPLTNSFRGVRRVWMRGDQGAYATEFEFLEEIATDGEGRFTIRPREVLTPNISGAELEQFQLLQSGREGFFFRSRDFSIRNLGLFWQNYTVDDLGLQMDVSGVSASLFDVSRSDGEGFLHRIAVDPATGVVLFHEESTPEGVLISRLTYESFAYDATLSDLELTGGPSAWVPFTPASAQSMGFNLLRPTAPPAGFAFQGASTLSGFAPAGETWARLVYGDGVDQVFFAFSTANGTHGVQPAPALAVGDAVRVMSFGPWTMAEGRVGGLETLAIGKVDEGALLLMLQSALETQ